MQAILSPAAIYVLVPSTKQEATFEFTQETKDGIPLRFKGIIIYRITDPLAAARLFDFSAGTGSDRSRPCSPTSASASCATRSPT